MSSDHIRWDFAAADDFDAELSNEKAFNADSLGQTDGAYRSLSGQLDGGSGSDQNMSLNRGHISLYDEVGTAGVQAQTGLADMQESHRSGMTRALNRLQG
ncbi:MAG: hypothetical protein H0V59_05170 [Nocardioidaceae bacterium]|jgi:hypothetical protein|nr:hypothetical protein [Nocardioidaceae bacterium]